MILFVEGVMINILKIAMYGWRSIYNVSFNLYSFYISFKMFKCSEENVT